MKLRIVAMTGFFALAALGTASLAFTGSKSDDSEALFPSGDFRALDWSDLSPPLSSEAKRAAAELNLRIDQMTDEEIAKAMAAIEAEGSVLMTELDGTDVSLEGFLVPLDFDAEKVSDFVLVPYFGACIHVPPPPPNQIVYVQYREGLPMAEIETSFYTPFRVKGRIKAAHAKTDLADVGYQLTASDIEKGEGL